MRGPRAVRWSFALVLAAVAVVSGGQHREVDGKIEGEIVIAVEAAPRTRAMGTMTIANEYLPRWVPSPRPWPMPTLDPWIGSGEGRVSRVLRRGSRVEFEVGSQGPVSVVVPSYWFPGWRVTANGRPAPAGPDPAGFVRIDVPPGRNAVVLEFGTTPFRIAAWAITLGALVTTAYIAVRAWPARKGGVPGADRPLPSGADG